MTHRDELIRAELVGCDNGMRRAEAVVGTLMELPRANTDGDWLEGVIAAMMAIRDDRNRQREQVRFET